MRRALLAVGLVLLWSVPGLLTSAATLVLFPQSPSIGGDPQRFVIVNVAPWLVWTLLTPAIIAFAQRVPLERTHLARAAALHAGAAVFCGCAYVFAAAVTSLVVQRVSPVVMKLPPNAVVLGSGTGPAAAPGQTMRRPPEPLTEVFRGMISSRFPIGLIVYATVAGIGMAMHERVKRRDRDVHAVRLEADLARAELHALQMQLQPHFLFNTLHAISVLVDENPKGASRMIAQLGDLLRETLRLSGTLEVPLSRELDLLRQYLAIEQTRLGARLRVDIDAPAALHDISVPSFILQPLVENAVRHGVAPRVEPGRVTVRAERTGNRLRMTIADDGPGFGAHRDTGIGLSATRDRLAVRYRDDASLTCATGPNGGALVTVDIPISDA